MSQAEALLNSLVETSSAYSSDSELRIVIGEDRFITVPESLKRIAVQYDHNIETVTFDCPRYWDEHDMSQMKIYINYMLPNGKAGQYLAQNVIAGSQRMTFDWTISNNVTQLKGNLAFLVCVKRTDSNGDEERHWNSELNRDLYISEGLECMQTAISRYPDIVTQLLLRMDEVEAIATPEAMQAYTDTWLDENKDMVLAEIAAKGEEVLATIPEDYETVATWADEGAHKKANAIEQTVEGEAIVMSDSADAYLLGLNVYGKTTQVSTTGAQLFDADAIPTTTSDEVGITNNGDGSFTISGTITTVSFSKSKTYTHDETVALLKAGTITLTAEKTTRPYFYLSLHNSEGRLVELNTADRATVSTEISEEWLADTTMYMIVGFYIGGNGTVVGGTVKPMLYQIGDGTWEPYSGGVASPSPEWPQELVSIENPTSKIYGKNLLNNIATTTTAGGITFTVNSDGSVIANGTATSSIGLIVNTGFVFPTDDRYILSGCPANGSESTYKMYVQNSDWSGELYSDMGSGCILTPSKFNGKILVRIWIVSGTTVSNIVFKPMIRLASKTDAAFEMYKGTQTSTIPYTLAGIPVTSGGNYTDANGQQWVCDEIDFKRGVYVQRIGVATMNSGVYTEYIFSEKMESGQLVVAPNPPKDPSVYGTLCNVAARSDEALNAVDGQYYENPANIVFVGNATDDETSLRLKYNTFEFLYVLATPIETPLTAEEIANFKMVRTNYPNTTVLNDSGVWMKLSYGADTKTYVDNNIKTSISDVLEAIENGSY